MVLRALLLHFMLISRCSFWSKHIHKLPMKKASCYKLVFSDSSITVHVHLGKHLCGPLLPILPALEVGAHHPVYPRHHPPHLIEAQTAIGVLVIHPESPAQSFLGAASGLQMES